MFFAFLLTIIQAIKAFDDPEPDSIPISIDVNSMKKVAGGCNTDIQCTTENINPECEAKCWATTSTHYFEYKFKGVKFQVFGSYQNCNGNFSLYLDGKFVKNIDLYRTTNKLRTLIYSSDILTYDEHTIKCQWISQQYEIYKFTF